MKIASGGTRSWSAPGAVPSRTSRPGTPSAGEHKGEIVPQLWTYEHTVPGGQPARAFVWMQGHTYTNFADRFGLEVIGYVEPRPGIPPTPQHTLDVIGEMKRQNIKLILVEPYFDLKTPNSIARNTGAQVVVLPPSVGGVKEITDYIGLFDYDINLLVNAIKQSGAR